MSISLNMELQRQRPFPSPDTVSLTQKRLLRTSELPIIHSDAFSDGLPDFPADISAVTVLNHTTPLQSRYGDGPFAHRLALQEDHHNQRILLRVEGNIPEYNLNCKRWCILCYLRKPSVGSTCMQHKINVSPIDES